jgi:hypothetical protein
MFVSNIAEDQAACSARSNSHAESASITYVFKASTFATHLSTDVLRRGRGLPLIHLRVDFTEAVASSEPFDLLFQLPSLNCAFNT